MGRKMDCVQVVFAAHSIHSIEYMSAIETRSEEATPPLNGPEDESGDQCDGSRRAGQSRAQPLGRASRRTVAGARKKIYVVVEGRDSRAKWRRSLKNAPGLKVWGAASAPTFALQSILRLKPELVLVDYDLPGERALKLIKALRSVDPSVKLLVLSARKEALHAARAMRSGADGYIVKEEDADEIVCAVRDVLKGHIYISEAVMEMPRSEGQGWNFRRANSPVRSLKKSKRMRI
jgi:DNA-binding NarL/FixJ family response regulator